MHTRFVRYSVIHSSSTKIQFITLSPSPPRTPAPKTLTTIYTHTLWRNGYTISSPRFPIFNLSIVLLLLLCFVPPFMLNKFCLLLFQPFSVRRESWVDFVQRQQETEPTLPELIFQHFYLSYHLSLSLFIFRYSAFQLSSVGSVWFWPVLW